MALPFNWLLRVELQAWPTCGQNNCDSPRYSANGSYIQDITARPGLLSVTESVVALPPQPKGGHMPKSPRFNLSEWLVPPVLMPMVLVLLVAAAMVAQW
jgi:hypothetical protein